MISFSEAESIVLSHTMTLDSEYVALDEALGRVTVENTTADRNYPPFNRATMDGFAIRFEDWAAGIRSFEIIGQLLAGGDFHENELRTSSALRIMTGAATPKAYTAIIRIEDCEVEGNMVKFNIDHINIYQNIAKEGEDFKTGDIVLPRNTEITIGNISALASVGIYKVKVFKLPRISVITTGDEIVTIDSIPNANQIRNSNIYTIKAVLSKIGLSISSHVHIKDDPNVFDEKFQKIIDSSDIVLLTGAVSAGVADFIPMKLVDNGIKNIFHKVKIKPGKPIWFGKTKSGDKFIFALPGNPLSVLTTMKIFVEPFLYKIVEKHNPNIMYLPLAVDRRKKTPLDELVPVIILKEKYSKISPIQVNGSGDISASINAQGLMYHSFEKEMLSAGEFVKLTLL